MVNVEEYKAWLVEILMTLGAKRVKEHAQDGAYCASLILAFLHQAPDRIIKDMMETAYHSHSLEMRKLLDVMVFEINDFYYREENDNE